MKNKGIYLLIIIAICIIIFMTNYKKKNIENIKKNNITGIVIKVNKNSFHIRKQYSHKIYKINKMIPEIKISDIINITYLNKNINNIDEYKLFKIYNSKNEYILNSYMKQKKEKYIIKSNSEYKKFIQKNNIINPKKYNTTFFKNNNLYIILKNSCSDYEIINTYKNNNNNLIIEITSNNNCNNKNITKYFIVEAKKNIKDYNLYINNNNNKYYESYNSYNGINLYVWKQNNKLLYSLINDKDLKKGQEEIIYIKSMPLTIEQASRIIKNKYNNDSINIVGETKLSKKELNIIIEKIGVE